MRRILHRIAYAVVSRYSRLRWKLRTLGGGVGPVRILPYLGYGTARAVYVSGRAVAHYRVRESLVTDSLWRNIVNTIRRFNALSIPETQVRVRIGHNEQIALTNTRGHFRIRLALDAPLPEDKIWHEVDLTLVDYADQPGAHAISRVFVPTARAAFGVISDLDDTVIQTNVVSKIKTVVNTFMRNAHTRLSFPGVAAFYRGLQQGINETWNPLFYISTSPNTLYDMLMTFMRLKNIPPGPMFLINMGMTKTHFFRPNSRQHKQREIMHILDTYAPLPFLLIGDSSEHDPEIYLDTLRYYPKRIKAIYIRDLSHGRAGLALRRLSAEAHLLGVDLLLVPDTLAAAQHAANHGLITQDAVEAVRTEIHAPR